MPKSKKPRKPKPLKKKTKGEKTGRKDAPRYQLQRGEGAHKSGADVQVPMHNRQPPQRGG